MPRQLEGSRAVAETIACCRPEVIAAYPISPQTHIVEALSQLVKTGELAPCEFINVESEFAAMSVAIGASAAGARSYTATASQGLEADFGRKKQRVADLESLRQLPHHRFRGPIRRRTVDHLAAKRLKLSDGFPERNLFGVVFYLFVAARRSDSDNRNAFTRRGNFFLNQWLRRRRLPALRE